MCILYLCYLTTAASSVILPLVSSISWAISLVLGMPLVTDRAKFRSLLSAAVYLIDSLTVLTPWLPHWLPDCLIWLLCTLYYPKFYYPKSVLAPWACTLALCDYTPTWEILWHKTLYCAKTLVLLYIQRKKKEKLLYLPFKVHSTICQVWLLKNHT